MAFIGILFSQLIGSRLGIAALMGAAMIIAVPIAFVAGQYKGIWQTEASMISKIEKVNLQIEIANLRAEKALWENAAKAAETDRSELENQAAKLAGERDDYKKKLEMAGRKCDLTSDDICDIYGLQSPQCRDSKRKKSKPKSSSLAEYLSTGSVTGIDSRCENGPRSMRRYQYDQLQSFGSRRTMVREGRSQACG